jgi:hypothetical protein
VFDFEKSLKINTKLFEYCWSEAKKKGFVALRVANILRKKNIL